MTIGYYYCLAERDPPSAGSRDFPPTVPQYAGPPAGLIPDAKGRGRTLDQHIDDLAIFPELLRRGRDSNPRYSSSPYTRLAGGRFQPAQPPLQRFAIYNINDKNFRFAVDRSGNSSKWITSQGRYPFVERTRPELCRASRFDGSLLMPI